MGVDRLSSKLRETGVTMTTLGLIALIAPLLIPTTNREEGAAVCSGIGGVLVLLGLPLLIAYYCYYRVTPGFALVDKKGRVEPEGHYFGLPPSSPTIISIARRVVDISRMELETPDEGILEASVSISYSPDLNNPAGLSAFGSAEVLERAIYNRVRGALNVWSMGKPLPGTVKRAAAMQKEAEIFLRGQLIGSSSFVPPVDDSTLYLSDGFIINDFGIRINEINMVSWRAVADGTGKPDWGDGDHTLFDAQSIFKQMHSHADNLSNLRRLKEALIEKYKEEESDIEDIYDSVRISMKENRER